MRMEAARRKFAEGTSVKEAAFQLGYRHAGDLSRAYHRHFDSSPTASGRRGEHPETWRPV
jgi:AraC-like DNA-binding protein